MHELVNDFLKQIEEKYRGVYLYQLLHLFKKYKKQLGLKRVQRKRLYKLVNFPIKKNGYVMLKGVRPVTESELEKDFEQFLNLIKAK